MAELSWKNTVVCAVLEDKYVKSEVYKPNCKGVYQLDLQKRHFCFFSAVPTLSLISSVGSSLDTTKSFFSLSVWDDKLSSTPKIITFLEKPLQKLIEPATTPNTNHQPL